MKLRVAWIGRTKEPAIESLTTEYLNRISRYTPCESMAATSESSLVASLAKPSRTSPVFVALDSGGKQLSSEELAAFIQAHQDRGTQELVFAIGPADGWREQAKRKAALVLSLGRMTLPHELARVVLLEQIYRAFTILKNHPYHRAH